MGSKFICKNCQSVLDYEDCEEWWVINFLGEEPEQELHCPGCRSLMTEAAVCSSCGEYCEAWKMVDGLCGACLDRKTETSNIHPVFQGTLNALRNGPNVFGGGK